MKIIFVVPFLNGMGGIQSSLINLLNILSLPENQNEYEITLCVFGNYLIDSNSLNPKVKIIRGNKRLEYCLRNYKDTIKNASLKTKVEATFIKFYKKVFGFDKSFSKALKNFNVEEQYDVAIAYSNDIFKAGKRITGGSNDIVLKTITANKKLAWIHNDADELGFTHDVCSRVLKDFDAVVNVSFASKDKFDSVIPTIRDKSKVVYNMVDIDRIVRLAKDEPSPYNHGVLNIVTVARINNQQKRIDRIIKCCKHLKDNHISNFKWTIVGDGEDLDSIKSMIKSNNLENLVVCVGKKLNPFPYIKNADLFVLSSAYEAYPMTIIESLALKTPVLTTEFDSARELIDDYTTGFVCENSTEGLIYQLQKLIMNPEYIKGVQDNLNNGVDINSKAIEQFKGVVKN